MLRVNGPAKSLHLPLHQRRCMHCVCACSVMPSQSLSCASVCCVYVCVQCPGLPQLRLCVYGICCLSPSPTSGCVCACISAVPCSKGTGSLAGSPGHEGASPYARSFYEASVWSRLFLACGKCVDDPGLWCVDNPGLW